ncbi:MAG: hypothetical protein RLZZ299_1938 [Pseudomonadota bacterium]|jgi:hypothetical protein
MTPSVLILALGCGAARAGARAEAAWVLPTLKDPHLVDAFGTFGPHGGEVRAGWGARFVDVGVRLGGAVSSGRQVAADGRVSEDEEHLLIVPVAVDATVRLDLLPEGRQPVVPFVRAGLGGLAWRDSWDDPGVEQVVWGVRRGWEAGGGLALRLDAIDPEGASAAVAGSGILDSWIVAEWRRSWTVQDAGLDFGRSAWRLALAVDW